MEEKRKKLQELIKMRSITNSRDCIKVPDSICGNGRCKCLDCDQQGTSDRYFNCKLCFQYGCIKHQTIFKEGRTE